MRGGFEASIFQRIFLEYGGSREEYEKNILELFKKNIVKRLTYGCSNSGEGSAGAKVQGAYASLDGPSFRGWS